MNEQAVQKQPPHELIPVLVSVLEDERADSGALVARQAFETAIGEICHMVEYMVVPPQDLDNLMAKFEAVGAQTDSREVRRSLAELIDGLKEENPAG